MYHKDPVLRQNATEAYGRLCAVSPDVNFLPHHFKRAIEHMVSHTDAESRAGCVQFLGSAYEYARAINAKPILKPALDVITSLIRDPHPLVHGWGLVSLAEIVLSAGLDVQPHLRKVMTAILHVCAAPSHDPETASQFLTHSNSSLPILEAACMALDSLVISLGPAIREAPDVLLVIKTLTLQLIKDGDNRVASQASRLLQRLLLVAHQALNIGSIVEVAREQLVSTDLSIRRVAVDTAYQLVQRDASLMSRLGGDEFVRYLLAIFDESPDIQGIWQTLRSWIAQTSTDKLSGWISIFQSVIHVGLHRDRAYMDPGASAGTANDEDEESLGLGSALQSDGTRSALRWQTHRLCLQCLQDVVHAVEPAATAHDPSLTTQPRATLTVLRKQTTLRLPDLIKIAFGAISSRTTQVRLHGLAILESVIKV